MSAATPQRWQNFLNNSKPAGFCGCMGETNNSMERCNRKRTFFCILAMAGFFTANGQQMVVVDSSQPFTRKVIAGAEYNVSNWKQFWWGSNYRREWTTPVTVPVLNLDTVFGGLTPVALGGGRQTKTLHLQSAQGKSYVLRTVNKTYSNILPPEAKGTFLETIANDQVSTLHPYAALTVPSMASATGIYSTRPLLGIVPNSPRLGAYNSLFANTLCLLEEYPNKTQTDKQSFGRPDDIDASPKMVENVTSDNVFQVDQHVYVKTRLFDMLIGDWGRHLDNWRWAQFDSSNTKLYKPIPRDRDQLYARFEGVMMKVVKALTGLRQLQSFGPTIKDIVWYNFPAMDIDRRFTSGLTQQTWIDSARALQASLTDNVIESAVRQLPPEVFSLSGQAIIQAIKQRRNDLASYAAVYYKLLSEYVDIPGSAANEWFDVKRLNDRETAVRIYRIGKEKEKEGVPFFSRTFLTAETKEIRLYGIGGNDIYTLDGTVNKGITVRIIGGSGRDSVFDASQVKGLTHRTKIYDQHNTVLNTTSESKIRLRDTAYVYPFEEDYHYNYTTHKLVPGLNPFYRLYIGAAYKKRVYGWREKPYNSDLQIGLNFSLFEKSFHPYIRYSRPQLFGVWNVQTTAGYDGARRLNYFGLVNETTVLSDYRRFHWLRTENLYATVSINRPILQRHYIYLTFFYDGVRVLQQEGRFVSESNPLIDSSTYRWKHFAGTSFDYTYSHFNDPLVPTKGLGVSTDVAHTISLQQKNRSFTTASALIDIYQPLFSSFSLYIRSGGATLWGRPEFYQHNTIGGGITLRGYVRNRFYGRTVYYQQNELRFIKSVKSYLFNGKAGLIALYDFGRVWQPGETTGKWHYGVGGGILVAPFQRFSARVYYTISPESRVFNLRVGRFF